MVLSNRQAYTDLSLVQCFFLPFPECGAKKSPGGRTERQPKSSHWMHGEQGCRNPRELPHPSSL